MPEESKTLRIGVEPVEVEIDEDDDGILWTSIQTAFPGCSGMYYRNAAGLKSSVKFDGKKFRAPSAGSWRDYDFYVALSQRCHSVATNSSTYSEATKQFEKSVQAVQKMMIASGMKIDLSHLSHKKSHRRESSTNHSSTSESSNNETIEKIQSKLEKRAAQNDLTPIEQQFLDLARISTAKDEIINANRQEIQRLRMLEEELRVANAKIDAQEEELMMLRSLGTQFGETKETVQLLTQESDQLQTTVTELQLKLMNAQEENESLKGRLETSENRVKEVGEQLAMLTTTKEILTKELNELRPFADAAAIDDYENIPTYIETLQENRKLAEEMRNAQTVNEMTRGAFDQLQNVQTPIFEENAKLRKKNEDLERRFEHVDEEIKCLNEQWAKEMRDKQNDWQMLRTEFENEILNQREQIQHLQHFLEAATREAAENARRQNEKKQPLNNSDDRVKKVDVRKTSTRKKRPPKVASKCDLKRDSSNEHNQDANVTAVAAAKRRSIRQRRSKHSVAESEEKQEVASPVVVAAALVAAPIPPPHPKRAATSRRATHATTTTKRQYTVAASPSRESAAFVKRKMIADKMPDALKVVKLDVEERTCARTRKKKEKEEEAVCDDDVINNENDGKLFDETTHQPFWTLELFNAEEAEKEGIEVEGRITAEHVLKYLEGTLAPIQPPDTKYTNDWLKSVEEMRAADDAFFSEDAIMYHTLRNIISSENALKRCTENSGGLEEKRSRSKSDSSTKKSESFEDVQTTIRFNCEEIEKVSYIREKPIESVRKYLKIRDNLRKWDAI